MTSRAIAQDDLLLKGLMSNGKGIDTLSLSRLALYEPSAVMVRRDDRSLLQLYASCEINAIYDK